MADYEQMVRDLMQVLSTGESLRPDQPYTSKDPGTKYRSGEVTSDVGLLDPVELLAGLLASKGASLVRGGAQALRRSALPQSVDIPFDRYPLPSSTIPKGPEIDLSPDPLPALDPAEGWLGKTLEAMRQRRVTGGLDEVQGLSADTYDRDLIDFYLRMRGSGGYGGTPNALPGPTPIDPLYIPHPRHLRETVDPGGHIDLIQLAMEQIQRAKQGGDEANQAYWMRVLQNVLKKSGGTDWDPTERGLP